MAKARSTIEKLAGMMKRGFGEVRKDIKNDLKHFATKDDLKGFATEDDVKASEDRVLRTVGEDLKQFATKDDMKASEVRILEAVDKIAPTFDKAEKDHAADKLLHDRHEKRLEKVEAKLGVTHK